MKQKWAHFIKTVAISPPIIKNSCVRSMKYIHHSQLIRNSIEVGFCGIAGSSKRKKMLWNFGVNWCETSAFKTSLKL